MTEKTPHSPRHNFLAVLKYLQSIISNTFFLRKTSAPAQVYLSYYRTISKWRTFRRFQPTYKNLVENLATVKHSSDWFTGRMTRWLYVFDLYRLNGRPLDVLEIGSWEGMSARFILATLTKSQLICVDTWKGSDEHLGSSELESIENNFDANTLPYRDRLVKFKGTSFNYFNSLKGTEQYDLIYVDGSHYCDDVMIDALRCFEMLKVGGIMIFDDYLWRFYKKDMDNPAGAINAFLKLKKGAYKIILVHFQLMLEKTSARA